MADVEIKAVIPAAGLGTRLLPWTRAVPKEMLPVGRKPLVQHVVEEAVAAGLRRICIVLSEGKESIREHFLRPATGEAARRDAHVAALAELTQSCELRFVFQPRPAGLGDALRQAREFVGRDPFVMLVPDQLMLAPVPATAQLVESWRPGAAVWTSLVRVPRAELPLFAGARGFEFAPGDGALTMGRILTEEETRALYREQPYEVRGFGRTIYPPDIFDYLGPEFTNPRTGEVDLLLTFERMTERLGHRGVMLEGEPLDLGTFAGYYHYLPRLAAPEAR